MAYWGETKRRPREWGETIMGLKGEEIAWGETKKEAKRMKRDCNRTKGLWRCTFVLRGRHV